MIDYFNLQKPLQVVLVGGGWSSLSWRILASFPGHSQILSRPWRKIVSRFSSTAAR